MATLRKELKYNIIGVYRLRCEFHRILPTRLLTKTGGLATESFHMTLYHQMSRFSNGEEVCFQVRATSWVRWKARS